MSAALHDLPVENYRTVPFQDFLRPGVFDERGLPFLNDRGTIVDTPPSPPAPPENTRDRGHYGVCLHGVKDSANVGGAMRAAHVFGADYVMTINSRTGKHKTDTSKAYRHVPVFEYILEDNAEVPAPKDTKIVVVELCAEAMSLNDFEHPERAIYVFGPEDGNVPQHVIDAADSVVYIPANLCLNLAAAVNVVLYDRQSKENN